ncbi:MAG: hypothetical protein KF812_02655 [Fimbriimonadaceae bacterium]|nr:hypothetical protein [Fimbriimonadaceae bacterium]
MTTLGGEFALRVLGPTGASELMKSPPAGANFAVAGMNSSRVVCGSRHKFNSASQITLLEPYYWPSPEDSPIAMIKPAGVPMCGTGGISDAGAVVGGEAGGSGPSRFFYWTSVTATPMILTVPANTNLVQITKSGRLIFRVAGSPDRYYFASGPNATSIEVQIPPTYSEVNNVFEGDDGTLVGTAIDGAYLTIATKANPVTIHPSTGACTVVANPVGESKVEARVRNASGWMGGVTGFSGGKIVLYRNSGAVVFDDIAEIPMGVSLTSIVKLFGNGSALVQASDGRHFFYESGSF